MTRVILVRLLGHWCLRLLLVMALMGTLLGVISTLVPITVLLLLVVEVHRKGREHPPVMRGWWVLLGVTSSLVPLIVLLLLVVEMSRKGREHPPVMRG